MKEKINIIENKYHYTSITIIITGKKSTRISFSQHLFIYLWVENFHNYVA